MRREIWRRRASNRAHRRWTTAGKTESCPWGGQCFIYRHHPPIPPANWNTNPSLGEGEYGFRIFDHKLSAEDLQAGTAYLATAFPDKCKVIAKQQIEWIMLGMAKLAQIKHQEENGISAIYWQKFFRDQFHIDLCVRNIWQVLKAAMELGIIEKYCGWNRGRSTMYTVGKRMRQYVAVPSPISGSIILVRKMDQGILPDDWEEMIEKMVTPIEDQLLLA